MAGPGRPKGQGKTPGSGRKKGTPNKATADIKALAQKHGAEAIKKLVALMRSEDERTRVAAIKELLDRGYGRAHQEKTVNVRNDALTQLLREINARNQPLVGPMVGSEVEAEQPLSDNRRNGQMH